MIESKVEGVGYGSGVAFGFMIWEIFGAFDRNTSIEMQELKMSRRGAHYVVSTRWLVRGNGGPGKTGDSEV